MELKDKDIKRFFEKFDSSDVDACWEWKASRDKAGYGRIGIDGKVEGAHRVSWTIHYGEIPNELWVLHKCDNRRCVNPKHLFIGTGQDNVNDMIKKGRKAYGDWSKNFPPAAGELNPNSILKEEDIPFIRSSPLPNLEIGKMLGVSRWTISDVRNRRSWKHVP